MRSCTELGINSAKRNGVIVHAGQRGGQQRA